MLLPGEIKPRTILLNSVRSIYTQFLDGDERRFIVEKNPKRIHYVLKKDNREREKFLS